MSVADEQSYEEVISRLNQFIKDVGAVCDDMTRAGSDCYDNKDQDPAAYASCVRLADCIKSINMNVELVEQVCDAMRAQIDRIREKARKASQY